ncbi:hypothetical protein BOX15_Mlig028202g3, partial [Macrostomum lignano]
SNQCRSDSSHCSSQKSMLIKIIISLCFYATAAATATEFSTESVAPSVPAAAVSSWARSDIECAVKCSAAGPAACSASAFLPQSELCLMSAEKGADFSEKASQSSVLRRLTTASSSGSAGSSWSRNASYVTIADRTFRIIQHRSKGALSFAQNWTDYEHGFGDDVDFWIGLRTINELTGSTPRVLRVEAVTWADELFIAEYSGFTVGDASTNYTMTYTSYLTASSNMTGDALAYHKGSQFSTMDRDNDGRSGSSCSVAHCGNGGWWYSSCAYCNPSGVYETSAIADSLKKMMWKYATGGTYAALKSIQLMVQV